MVSRSVQFVEQLAAKISLEHNFFSFWPNLAQLEPILGFFTILEPLEALFFHYEHYKSM